ncbi:MAG: tail fiber protein [Pyrinomonadaceae bacterium]
MSEPFIAQIMMFGGNFNPRGWAFCNGQILSIAQNTALFSILGTTYGGNGQTTFALPDLRSRVPVHWGQGPGLSSYSLGQSGGAESTTLLQQNLPAAAPIQINANAESTTSKPNNNFPSSTSAGNGYAPTGDGTKMNPGVITGGLAGGSSIPFSILQPYLAVSFIIALEGIFPSRN